MINPSPALLIDLQRVLDQYSYTLKHAVINSKQDNHRYVYINGDIKLLVELSNDK